MPEPQFHDDYCWCYDCRMARRKARIKRNQRELMSKPIPDEAHGKYSTYTNRGCRCDKCTAAQTEYRNKYNAKKRANVKRRDV